MFMTWTIFQLILKPFPDYQQNNITMSLYPSLEDMMVDQMIKVYLKINLYKYINNATFFQ